MLDIPTARAPRRVNRQAASSQRHATMNMAAVKKQKRYDDLPDLGDLAAWSSAAQARTWAQYRDGDLLEAFDAFRGIHDDIAKEIGKRLVARVQRFLAKRLANRRYGREHDIWKTREQDITAAILLPQTKNGTAIRKSFVNHVDWGTVNLIRDDLKTSADIEPYDDDCAPASDPTAAIEASIDVDRARERFANGDQRKVQCLVMHDMGFTQEEIRGSIGVSHVTQKRWRDAFAAYLANLGIG